MDCVLCDHAEPCVLKLGLKPGPYFNQSIYICPRARDKCPIVVKSIEKPKKCPVHKAWISVRMLNKDGKSFNFVCANRDMGKICGKSVITAGKENRLTSVGNQSTQMKARNSATPAGPQVISISDDSDTSSDSEEECTSPSSTVSQKTETGCSPCLSDTGHSSSSLLGGGSVASQELSDDQPSGVQVDYKNGSFDKKQSRDNQDSDKSINSDKSNVTTGKSNPDTESEYSSSEEYASCSNSFLNNHSGVVANGSPSHFASPHSDSKQISPKASEIETELDQEVSMSVSFASAESANPDESRDSEMDTEDPVNTTNPDASQSEPPNCSSPNASQDCVDNDESGDPVNTTNPDASQSEPLNCSSPNAGQYSVDHDESENPVNTTNPDASRSEPPDCSSPNAGQYSVDNDESENPVNTTNPDAYASPSEPLNCSSPNADPVDDDDSDESDIVCTGSELLTDKNKSKSPALVESNTASAGFNSDALSFGSKPMEESVDSPSTMTTNSDENKDFSVRTGTSSDPVDLVGDDTQTFKVGHQTKTVMRQYMEIEHILQAQAAHLPDGGAQLRAQKAMLKRRLVHLNAAPPKVLSLEETGQILKQRNIVAQSKMLTTGAIVHLHSSLENCPTEDTLADDPPGLTVPLMIHQKRALAWMEWRENQTPAAGILADDMGLGKTLSILSLVWLKKGSRDDVRAWMSRPPPRAGLVKSPATLVVCPASLLLQWEEEARIKISGRVSVYIYHGKKITHDPYDLVNYDIVLTTYAIVGGEGASCAPDEPESKVPKRKKRTVSHTTLFQIHWRRVVLDEAHNIKNPKSGMSMGACNLSADYRWAVTGTPIQNCLKDFYSLIKFIHLAPFDDYKIWKDTVEKKKTLGMQRLNTMVSSLVLRRTKADLNPEHLRLTKKIVVRHSIKLSEDEMAIHRYMFIEAKKVMITWLMEKGEDVREETDSVAEVVVLEPDIEPIITRLMRGAFTRGKGSCVLWLLLRLRQSCCHMKLLVNGMDGSAPVSKDDVDLDLMMGTLTLDNPPPADIDLSDLPAIFLEDVMSTKVASVVSEITRIISIQDDPPQKCVVVSQWTNMLDIVEYHLNIIGIFCTRIDGKVVPGERLNRVKQLNSTRKNPSVMLLSLQAGGVGLNLVGANHLFLLDMHWNPALEQQAADRCHRVGQKRDVHIHKFVCAGTVEEKILELQEKKLLLASDVMSGASQRNRSTASKLSLTDLRDLFELM